MALMSENRNKWSGEKRKEMSHIIHPVYSTTSAKQAVATVTHSPANTCMLHNKNNEWALLTNTKWGSCWWIRKGEFPPESQSVEKHWTLRPNQKKNSMSTVQIQCYGRLLVIRHQHPPLESNKGAKILYYTISYPIEPQHVRLLEKEKLQLEHCPVPLNTSFTSPCPAASHTYGNK